MVKSDKLLFYLEKGLILFEVILLAIFISWHFRLGMVRYFDADEVTHLHWSYSLYIGERPYTDFFYLFPPFFLYPIAFLFALFGRTITALVEARVFIFMVFLATNLTLFLIGGKLRNFSVALLSAVIFVFLPLPQDKMLEVRPDLLATFLALLGLYLFIKGAEGEKKGCLFFSGLFYSLSLGFVPKTVFFLIPPILVLGYKFYKVVILIPTQSGEGSSPLSKSPLGFFATLRMTMNSDALPFFAGFLPSVLILLLLIFSFSNPAFALYSMTKMASVITEALAKRFYMRPDIFFYQNETYYGIAGYSLPYILNLLIYISASVFAIFRFISSFSYPDNKKCLREFLVGTSFFANLYAFVYLYPLKHAQYLIPVAPFIAFYFADLLESIKRGPLKSFRVLKLGTLLILLVLFLIGIGGGKMYGRKMQLGNKQTFDKVTTLLQTIPKEEAVFDLTGEAIFFRNGYYFCCLPYGQYEEVFGFALPNLEKDLEKRGTKYVHTGWLERLSVLPPMQAKYIKENYVSYFPDGSLLVRKKML